MGVVEKSYYGNGEVYKETISNEFGVVSSIVNGTKSEYFDINDISFPEGFNPDFFEIATKEKGDIIKFKIYRPSLNLYEFCKKKPTGECEDLSEYNLPKIDGIWVGVGRYDDNSEFDIFFSCKKEKELKRISNYFGLSFPLQEDNDFDENEEEWKSWSLLGGISRINEEALERVDSFRLCSVKYINNKPNLIKAYKSSYNAKNK